MSGKANQILSLELGEYPLHPFDLLILRLDNRRPFLLTPLHLLDDLQILLTILLQSPPRLLPFLHTSSHLMQLHLKYMLLLDCLDVLALQLIILGPLCTQGSR